MSLIIRQQSINGNVQTIQNSINSQGMIQSFKSMSNPDKNKQTNLSQRESILKLVLMQNTGDQGEQIYSGNKFVQEHFQSDQENEYEF